MDELVHSSPGGVPAGGKANIYINNANLDHENKLVASNISADLGEYILPPLDQFEIVASGTHGLYAMVEPTEDSSVTWTYNASPTFNPSV